MSKHQIEIRVCDNKGRQKPVLWGKEMTLRQRVVAKLLGNRRMLVLVPAEDILSVSIKEVAEE